MSTRVGHYNNNAGNIVNTESWGAWARSLLYLIISTDVGDHSEDTCNIKNGNASDDARVTPEGRHRGRGGPSGGLRGSNTF